MQTRPLQEGAPRFVLVPYDDVVPSLCFVHGFMLKHLAYRFSHTPIGVERSKSALHFRVSVSHWRLRAVISSLVSVPHNPVYPVVKCN